MKTLISLVVLLVAAQVDAVGPDSKLQALAASGDAPLLGSQLDEFKAQLVGGKLLSAEHVERETINAIGTLLLRADGDDAFQRKQTDDQSDLWTRVGIDVDPEAFAYLVDRIEQAHGRPPIFGGAPHLQGNHVVPPTEFVDAARDRIGLAPVRSFDDAIDRRLTEGANPNEILNRPLAMRVPNYPTDWKLRGQLIQLVRRDQSVREGKIDDTRMKEIDESDHAELTEIIRSHGFPSSSEVGRFGESAVWLIVQHQIQDPALMKRYRDHAKIAMEHGELAHVYYALLDDRIRCYIDGELELYGTQGGGVDAKGMFIPAADPEHLNERRAAMLMPPIDVRNVRGDCAQMVAAFRPKKPAPKK